MKFKTTLALLAVFALLLAVVLFFDSKAGKKEAAEEKANTLVDVASADVRKVTLARGGETLTLERDEAGPWRLVSPVQAAADDYEAGALVDALASLRIERVVETEAKDPAAYGIPAMEASLWVKGQDAPVRLLVGMENPLDKSLFAQRGDDPRVVLLASSLKTTLDKTVFDFRQKDVFKFTTADVRTVKVRAGAVVWQAARRDGGWFLESPVAALAAGGRIDALLDSLSGIRAKEFVAEEKGPGVLEKYGLAEPGYEIALSLPAAAQEIVFGLHGDGEAAYATTSLSTKVVAFDGTTLLADLDRKVDELREKKVSDFYAWDARRISVKRAGLELVAVREKAGEEDKWHLEPAPKEEADRAKVEGLIRKIEGLEAASFIDDPGPPAAYGLDAATEIRILTRDYQDQEKETVLLVGGEDAEKKQVVIRNALFDYLFRVDSAFLRDLPGNRKEWLPQPPQTDEGPADKK